MALPTLALTSTRELYIDVRANVRTATYKRLGRYAPASLVLLPNGPSNLKAWLSDRLGAIEWLQFDEPEPGSAQAEPSSSPISRIRSELPFLRAADFDPELAALYRCVVDLPPDMQKRQPVIPEVVRWRPPASDAEIRLPSRAQSFRHAAE